MTKASGNSNEPRLEYTQVSFNVLKADLNQDGKGKYILEHILGKISGIDAKNWRDWSDAPGWDRGGWDKSGPWNRGW